MSDIALFEGSCVVCEYRETKSKVSVPMLTDEYRWMPLQKIQERRKWTLHPLVWWSFYLPEYVERQSTQSSQWSSCINFDLRHRLIVSEIFSEILAFQSTCFAAYHLPTKLNHWKLERRVYDNKESNIYQRDIEHYETPQELYELFQHLYVKSA